MFWSEVLRALKGCLEVKGVCDAGVLSLTVDLCSGGAQDVE